MNQPQEQEQEDPAKGGEDWRDVGGKILNILNNSLTRKLTISEYKKLIKLIGSLFSEIERAKSEREEEILRWARKNAQPTNSGFEDEQRRIFLNDLINFISTPQEI